MSDLAAAPARIRAFAWDHLIVLGYLPALLGVGLFLTLGPT